MSLRCAGEKNKNMAAFIVPFSEVRKSLLYIHVHCMETIITLISWYTHARYIYSTVQNNPFIITTYEEIWILFLLKDCRSLRPGTRSHTESPIVSCLTMRGIVGVRRAFIKVRQQAPSVSPVGYQRHLSQRLKNHELLLLTFLQTTGVLSAFTPEGSMLW